MPITFTKGEVSEFLVEQGFDVTDDETLNKFIKDLKKIVKYEAQRRRRQRLGHDPDDTLLSSTGGTSTTITTTTSTTTPTFSSTSGGTTTGTGSSGSRGGGGESYQTKHGKRASSPPTPTVTVRFVGSDTDEDDRDYSSSSTSYYDDDDHHVPKSGEPLSSHLEEISVAPLTPLKELNKPKPKPEKKESKKQTSTSKGSNKYLMKRVTAVKTPTGDSVIEETDVDLAKNRRQAQAKSQPPPPSTRNVVSPASFVPVPSSSKPFSSRPRTAPSRSRSRGPTTITSTAPPRPTTPRQQSSRPLSASSHHGQRGRPTTRRVYDDECYCSTSGSEEELVFLEQVIADENEGGGYASGDDVGAKGKKIPLPPPNVARDPVLLYHWYKNNHWDIHSVPGEERHMQLRWNVRAKTVGGHMW